MPIKGQLTHIAPQPGVNYRASSRLPDGGNAGINPRGDGLIIGNSQEVGISSLEPNPEILARNLANAARFFAGMQAPVAGESLARSLPPSTPPPIRRLLRLADPAVTARLGERCGVRC